MPALSWTEIRQRAIAFLREWRSTTVFGMKRRPVASFEDKVRSLKGTWHRIDVFVKNNGLLDYVTLWYLKAADYMHKAQYHGPDGSGVAPTQDASAPTSGIASSSGADASSVSSLPSVSSALIYFNPHAPIETTQGDLPHWEQQRCTYFVTFRLADALPQDKLNLWKRDKDNWLHRNPPPHNEDQKKEYQQKFAGKIHEWLRQGHGSCLLRHRESAKIIADAMMHFHGQRYILHRATIMNNHVHALVTPLPGHKLRDILHSWKSFSANKINALHQKQGPLWQRESFDTIIRSETHLHRVLRYMDENAASTSCTLDLQPPAPTQDASAPSSSITSR